MNSKIVKFPRPESIFEAHMPVVAQLPNMESVFASARLCSIPNDPTSKDHREARQAVIVLPDRRLLILPMFDPKQVSIDPRQQAKSVLRSDRPLHISVIACTGFKGLVQDEEVTVSAMIRSIPFLSFLASYAYVGHTVVVFEGHYSALEAGIRNADLLIVDSGMLPFLQMDWATVAFRVTRANARIFVHDREHYALLPVILREGEPGWFTTEPENEASYANCLLTTLTTSKTETIRISVGSPLPYLMAIATGPTMKDWVSTLPFRYDELDAEQVIETMTRVAKRSLFDIFTRSLTLKALVVVPNRGKSNAVFKLTQSKSTEGKQQLDIKVLARHWQ